MADLPDLNVKITADTSSLDAALKKTQDSAKKFGDAAGNAATETDNLSKKTTEAEGSLGSFGNSAKSAKVGIAAVATAAIAASAAIVAITKSASEAAKEIAILSNQAGVSAEEFQKLAFAANKVGVEQEKLGDIFKDARDKIGDFTATGGGELKDFFETVAPLAGVTAEEFKNLSGPQVLEKFQKALDDANVSANEQVFFLESLADEASRLQPLLTNNASALREYTRQAEEFNLTLSDFDVAQLRQAQSAFDDMATVIRVRTQQAVADLAPLISAVSQQFMVSSNSGADFGRVAFDSVKVVAQGVAAVVDGVRLLHAGFQGLVVVTAAVGAAVTSSIAAMATGIDEFLNNIKADLNRFVDFANSTGLIDLERFDTDASAIVIKTQNLAAAMQASLEQNKAGLGDILAGPTALQRTNEFFDGVEARAEEMRAKFEAEGSPLASLTGLGGGGNGLSTGGPGEGRDTSEEDMIAELTRQMELRRQIMEEFDVFEAERAIEKFEADKARLALAAENELITAEEKQAALQQLEEAHIGRMHDIYNRDANNRTAAQERANKVIEAMRQQNADRIVGILATLGQKHKAFALAAIAIDVARGVSQNIIATQVASMRALSDLGPILGPPVAAGIQAQGAIGNALIIGAGALQAAGTLSSGGGSGGGGAGAIGSSSQQASGPAGGTASPSQQSESSIVNINLEGEVFGREQVRSLIGSINEALDDGARLRVR